MVLLNSKNPFIFPLKGGKKAPFIAFFLSSKGRCPKGGGVFLDE